MDLSNIEPQKGKAMTKRIITQALSAIVLITLVFSGCGERLTETEYLDRLQLGFNEYIAALDDIENVWEEAASGRNLMQEHTKAIEMCKNAQKALEIFEEINPPEKFTEKHKALLKAVELEKKYIEAAKNVLTARTSAQMEEYATEAQNIFALVPEEQQFAMVYANLLSEARTAAES